jgi:hypothetical protein
MSFHYDPEDFGTAPQTEDSAESGYVKREPNSANPESYRDLGVSDMPGEDGIGDIADEGPGHRG